MKEDVCVMPTLTVVKLRYCSNQHDPHDYQIVSGMQLVQLHIFNAYCLPGIQKGYILRCMRRSKHTLYEIILETAVKDCQTARVCLLFTFLIVVHKM